MDDLEVFTDYGKRGSTIAKLKAEIEQLTADRSAFARETKEYRDVWMHDQIKIERLKKEIEILRNYGNKDCTARADEALAEIQALESTPS